LTQGSVLVRILSIPDMPDLGCPEVKCASEDISMRGIRLKIAESLPAGTTLKVAVDGGGKWGQIEHLGTVKWVRPHAEGTRKSFEVGVELTHTFGRLAGKWRKMVEHLLGNSAPVSPVSRKP
jgi:hypothetical protein